jgi:selenium metabolism protein YedF
MEEKLDLRGMLCPEPVIATKKLLDKTEISQVEALVDDDVCVANLERLARSLKAACSVADRQGFFAVTISKAMSASQAQATTHDHQSAPTNISSIEKRTSTGTVIFLSSDQLGQGDLEFGKTLLNVFLQSYFEGGHRPRAILMANSGVKLLAADSSAKKVLDDFLSSGVEVFACGLCVDYYKLKEQIKKEQITNMFAICEYLAAADKVIQF